MNRLDNLRKMMTGERPALPIAQLLGIDITGLEKGMVTLEMEASEKLHNPMGTLHGGVLGDLSNLAMSYAFYITLADDELLPQWK